MAADVNSNLASWSTSEASNSPSGSTAISTNLDDNLRQIQAVVRKYLATKGADLASGTTTDLSTTDGNFIDITGTTTITGFGTLSAGMWKVLQFDGALTLTHNATSLILPGAANITTAAGDCLYAYSLGSGNWTVPFYQKASGLPVIAQTTATTQAAQENSTKIATTAYVDRGDALRSYIAGFVMSTAGSSVTMTIAAGQATDSTNAWSMILSSSIGKTTSSWAVGTGNGGLDTGAIANSTWYHFYVIRRPDTGVVDVVFSTSASSPTLPANYTQYRRIGSGKTNGSAQWTRFFQFSNTFIWDVQVADYAATPSASTWTTVTCTVPLGISVEAFGNCSVNGGFLGGTKPAASNQNVPSTSSGSLGGIGATGVAITTMGGKWREWTNTSQQIQIAHSTAAAFQLDTWGWVDPRGQDS